MWIAPALSGALTAPPTRYAGAFRKGNTRLLMQGRLVFAKQKHQRGGLASNPPAQWCLVVAKPDLQHGIRRCDPFSGGRKHFGARWTPFTRMPQVFAV